MDSTIAPAKIPAAPPRMTDAERLARLNAMKWRATAMLIVAGGILAVALWRGESHPIWGYVRAASEAAVIGGLADWFAVTALFRRPLGLPIPHTAIIQAKKNQLGRTLGNFIQNHFLSREVAAKRLASFRVGERVAGWVADPSNSRLIAQHLATGLSKAVNSLPEENTRQLVHDVLVARLRSTPAAPMVGRALTVALAGNKHQELFSELVRFASRALEENRDTIRHRIRAESPWWLPGLIDERIYRKLVTVMEATLREIVANPAHPMRGKLDHTIERFISQLETAPDVIARAEALKDRMIDDPIVAEFSGWLWNTTRKAADASATAGEAGALERGIQSFGKSLQANPELLAELDRFISDATLAAIEQYREEIAELIAQTVASWDPDVTARRIELAIGRDLQFIRINGTLVGGLVGLALYGIANLTG